MTAAYSFRRGGRDRRGLRATAADERKVFVISTVADSLRFRLGRNESHFAYEAAAPGLVDAAAEFALHGLELALPRFAVRSQFEAVSIAADGPRVRGERLSDDSGPRACEPSKGRVRLLEPVHNASEKFSCAFHEAANSSTTQLWKCARLRRGFARAKIAKRSA